MDLIELKRVQHREFRRHPWEVARGKVLLFLLKKYCPGLRLLADIGSGDAFIAKSAAAALPHSKVLAVDIHYNEETRSIISENAPPNFGLLDNMAQISQQDGGTLDAIVLMDVIEHIEDPAAFLQEIKKLSSVNNSSHFFITVPAYQWLFTKHDEALGHYKRYTSHSLTELVKKEGFEVKETGYFFASLYLVRALQKWTGKDFSKDGLYDWKGGPLLTGIITSFFWTGFRLSRIFSRTGLRLPGLTCYCVCRPLPS